MEEGSSRMSTCRRQGGGGEKLPVRIDDKEEINLIDKLNYDCLVKVFSYLTISQILEMENVCKKWREAVELSWYAVKKLDLNDLMIRLDEREEILKIIMKKATRYLNHLTILDDVDHYPWISDILKINCQNITHFSIGVIKIMNNKSKFPIKSLVEIISLMKKLKYLKVKMIYGRKSNSNIFNEIVNELPDNIQEIHFTASLIKYLSVSWSPEMIKQYTIQKDTSMYPDIPALEKFNSLGCLTLQGFKITNEEIFNNNKLVKLDLSKCVFPKNTVATFKNLLNLEHLNLFKVRDFNVNGICSIARNCLKLNYLKIDIINERNDSVFIPINIFRELKYLNLLQHLDVGNGIFGRPGPVIIMTINDNNNDENWKQLKYLNIGNGMKFLKSNFEEIIKLNNLEYLNIDEAYNIDSQSFINITNNCRELKELKMDFNRITDKDALLKLKNLNKLEKLNFSNCENLTGNILSDIVINCNNLQRLEISRCENITRYSLIQVGKLKNLKILILDYIEKIPIEMFDYFDKLEKLKCVFSPIIVDEPFIKVIDNCPKLEYLDVRGTGITVETLIHTSKRKYLFKKLKIWVDNDVFRHYWLYYSTLYKNNCQFNKINPIDCSNDIDQY